jgi:hypothetical protein
LQYWTTPVHVLNSLLPLLLLLLLLLLLPADCPSKAGYITMASINWSTAGNVIREGQESTAAAAEAFCNSNKHCYAWNDYGFWMLTPPPNFAGFYAYEELCTYMKAGKKH